MPLSVSFLFLHQMPLGEMGKRTTWLLQGGNELFIIYLLHNQLIAEEVKRQARRQTQCRLWAERGQDSQHPWLGCGPYLLLTTGVSDVLGIHIISNKSLKPHTERMVSGGLEKLLNFPELPPGKLLPSSICSLQRIFADILSLEPPPPHPTWKRSLSTFLSVLRALLSLKYLPRVKQLEVKHLLEIRPCTTPHPFLQWGGQPRVTPKVTLGSSSQLRLDCGPIFYETGVKPLGVGNEVCSYASLTFLTVNLRLGRSHAPPRDVVFKSGPGESII